MKTKSIKKRHSSKFEKTFIPDSSAGLARSHRIIRIEKEKELIFMKLCEQIKLDDFRKKRSDNQRELRRIKRQKRYSTI